MTSTSFHKKLQITSCYHCHARYKISSQKIEKPIKCPKCQSIFVPKDYLVKDSAVQKNSTNKRKRSIIPIVILFLICCTAIVSWFLFKNKKIKNDQTLLYPSLQLDSKNKVYSSLNEIEVQEVLASYKNVAFIPSGFDLPESTVEQARPSRFFLLNCKEKADRLLNADETSSSLSDLFTQENVINFNNAYAKTKNPKYLSFVIKEFIKKEHCTVEEMISFSDILRTQRESVDKTDLNAYLISIDRLKAKIVELWDTKNPIQATSLLVLANALPLESFKTETLKQLKLVLELAFKNINKSRKDDLFLSPEESTIFSLSLIKLAWFYHLEGKSMPDYLYSLAEKESCRLAYRLEQDGCLPVWQKDEKRTSYTEEIYKAAVIFDRDDLRYIAYSGLRLGNAYPPKQKDFNFSELGLLIIRSEWNHAHSYIPPHRGFRLPAPDSIQITYNKNLNMLSISMGAITQFVFKTNKNFQTLKELEESFQFSYHLEGQRCQYKLEIEEIDLDLFNLSMPYKVTESGEIKSHDIFFPSKPFRHFKNTYEVTIGKNTKDKINNITFFARKQE